MRISLSVLGIILFASSVSAQDCSKFIIVDKYSNTTDWMSYEHIKDVMCKSEVQSSSSGRQVGISAGIPIPVLDDVFSMTFNGTYASSDWSKWSSGFCQSNYYEKASQLKNSNLASLFSVNSAEVVKACLLREPVYGYFEVADDGTAFTFTFNVQGKEKLKRATLKEPSAVKDCDPRILLGCRS